MPFQHIHWREMVKSVFLACVCSMALALRRDHPQMWPKLGDSCRFTGEESRVCVCLLSGNSHSLPFALNHKSASTMSTLLQLFLFWPGPAVPVGKELVPRTLFPDSALRQERPVCPGGGSVGGNGKSFFCTSVRFSTYSIVQKDTKYCILLGWQPALRWIYGSAVPGRPAFF